MNHELPLRTDAEMRGDNWAEKQSLASLRIYKDKLASQLNEITSREGDRKACHCPACTADRRRAAESICDALNDVIFRISPEKRDKQRYVTVDKQPKGWELILVKVKPPTKGGAQTFDNTPGKNY